MGKSIYPKRIQNMIMSSYNKKESAKTCSEKINRSRIAKKLKVTVSSRQIGTTYGNITRSSKKLYC